VGLDGGEGGGEGIEGRTCKPISSWRSILVASRRTVAKQSDTGYGIPLLIRFMIYLPIADAGRDKLAVIL